MEPKINVEAKDGVSTIMFYQGEALEPQPPRKLVINGTIDAVSRYLAKRAGNIDHKKCNIIVDRQRMLIALTVNENDFYFDYITGELALHPDFKKWGINSGEPWTPKQLSEFIKMNRASFVDKETAMKLSKELMDIRIKADKEVEKMDNNKGDYKAMVAQKIIKSNIPDSFTLSLPIFKGADKKTFTVEIYVSPDTFSCSLISPEVNDLVSDFKDLIIDEQIKVFQNLAPEIVIIEV